MGLDKTPTRPPTVEEAMAIIKRALTEEYRVQCYRFWREKYGEEFSDLVRAKVKARAK